MTGDNLALYVASYDDATSAREDFEVLKATEGPDLEVVAAVVMNRDADGKVDVLEVGDGTVGDGAWIGGGIGLVVGLFAPPLLAATAIGAGLGRCSGSSPRSTRRRSSVSTWTSTCHPTRRRWPWSWTTGTSTVSRRR